MYNFFSSNVYTPNFSRSIHFYTMMSKGTSGYIMTKDFDIRHLDNAPMCMEYITCQTNKNISYLAWGDTKGWYRVFLFFVFQTPVKSNC